MFTHCFNANDGCLFTTPDGLPYTEQPELTVRIFKVMKSEALIIKAKELKTNGK